MTARRAEIPGGSLAGIEPQPNDFFEAPAQSPQDGVDHYLMPIDARLETSETVGQQAVGLMEIVRSLRFVDRRRCGEPPRAGGYIEIIQFLFYVLRLLLWLQCPQAYLPEGAHIWPR